VLLGAFIGTGSSSTGRISAHGPGIQVADPRTHLHGPVRGVPGRIYTFYVSLTNWATGNVLERKCDRAARAREIASEAATPRSSICPCTATAPGRSHSWCRVPTSSRSSVWPADGRPRSDRGSGHRHRGHRASTPSRPRRRSGTSSCWPAAAHRHRRQLETLVLDIARGGASPNSRPSPPSGWSRGRRFIYDPETDTLFDAQEDRTCRAGVGTFICDDVPEEQVSDSRSSRRGRRSPAKAESATTCRCGDRSPASPAGSR
jgi:hypothetical protein